MGACVDPRTPSVLIVLRVWPLKPMILGAVSLPVWSFADWTWSQGQLRRLRAIPLEMPLLSTVIASPSLFTWAPLGIFLRLFSLWGLLPFPLSFSAFLSFPHNPYHNRLSETLVTDYLKTDLVHTPILIAYSGYRADWVRNLSFKITFPSSLLGSISVNLWRASLSLSRNFPGASFSSCSMFANLP